MIIKATIFYVEPFEMQRGYWVGESEELPMLTNCPDLQGQLCEFVADTREQIISNIISLAKHRGISGALRII